MLYFNGQKSKVALVKYNRNDYEKVLEGLEGTTITIPSSFTNINSNALKGLNNKNSILKMLNKTGSLILTKYVS